MEQKIVLLRMGRQKLLTLDEPTSVTGYLHERSVVEAAIDGERIYLLHLTPSPDGAVDPQEADNVAGKVERVRVEESGVFGKVTLLNTPAGREAESSLIAAEDWRLAPLGVGRLEKHANHPRFGSVLVVKDYRIDAFLIGPVPGR